MNSRDIALLDFLDSPTSDSTPILRFIPKEHPPLVSSESILISADNPLSDSDKNLKSTHSKRELRIRRVTTGRSIGILNKNKPDNKSKKPKKSEDH